MRCWHYIPLLLFSFHIFMFVLFSVFGLRKVCSLPNSVHVVLGKINPSIYWLEENKKAKALFRGNHLPKPIGIYHTGSGTGFFICTPFPNSFSIFCTYSANTVCVWQRQAFGTDDRATGLIQQPQHLPTLLNCCIFTNKWQSMWLPTVFERCGRKLPTHLTNLSDVCCLKITNNWSCQKKKSTGKLALTINRSQELVLTKQTNLVCVCFMFDLLSKTCCKCKGDFLKRVSVSPAARMPLSLYLLLEIRRACKSSNDVCLLLISGTQFSQWSSVSLKQKNWWDGTKWCFAMNFYSDPLKS